MLYIDIVDIIYFAIGIAVGAIFTTLVDLKMYTDCMEEICTECMDEIFKELKEGEITNE